MEKKIMILGAGGQIGTELTIALRAKYGENQVIASDIRAIENTHLKQPFIQLDVMDFAALEKAILDNGISQVYHLAALLSASAEKNPQLAWKVNMDGLLGFLDVAVKVKLEKVFWPSSIAAFGPSTPKVNSPQFTVMDPNTVYGISKLAGEGWCKYYHEKFGLDIRSIRYPGLISYKGDPGGGTTDYAVDIFYEALKGNSFHCFLQKDSALPMMFMDDAIRGTIELMETESKNVKVRSSYNFSAFSFTPEELAIAIERELGKFEIVYQPDFRQKIAEGWPSSIDDSQAREDWGWMPAFDLGQMVRAMLKGVSEKMALRAGQG